MTDLYYCFNGSYVVIAVRVCAGGEGTLYIQATKDSGYWFVTSLALRGRAFPKWPMAIYAAYTVLVGPHENFHGGVHRK